MNWLRFKVLVQQKDILIQSILDIYVGITTSSNLSRLSTNLVNNTRYTIPLSHIRAQHNGLLQVIF